MAKKAGARGHNEGTIREKFRTDKKTKEKYSVGWEARYTSPIHGQKSIFGKTRSEVAKKLTKILNEINEGNYTEPCKMTLEDWLKIWLNEYASNNIKHSTRVSYDYLIHRHVIPVIGNKKLAEIRADIIQRFYNEKAKNGRLDGKGGLNAKTIKNIHNMLHEAMEQAATNNMIQRNPCKAAILPKVKKKEMRVLTRLEQKKLTEAAKTERIGIGVILALATGIRLGELLGLQWRDVNIKAGTISINRTFNRLKNFDEGSNQKTKLVLGEPKTSKSKRVIPLQQVILNELREYKKNQNKEKIQNISYYNNEGFVIANEIGNPIDPRTFQDFFNRVVSMAKINKAHFHSLFRHTFATRALEAGIPAKTVSEILGHANISTTLDLYSHVSLELKRDSLEKLSELFTANPVEVKKKEESQEKVVNFESKSF